MYKSSTNSTWIKIWDLLIEKDKITEDDLKSILLKQRLLWEDLTEVWDDSWTGIDNSEIDLSEDEFIKLFWNVLINNTYEKNTKNLNIEDDIWSNEAVHPSLRWNKLT